MIVIDVNGRTYRAALADTEAARAFAQLLPMTLNLNELNGNEKYAGLDAPLPSAPERVGQIETGDLMLFGDDCVVLFYDRFSTGYTYTRLGHIDDPTGLAEALGAGDVQVTFSR